MLLPGELDGSQGLNRALHFSFNRGPQTIWRQSSYLITRAQEKNPSAYRRERTPAL